MQILWQHWVIFAIMLLIGYAIGARKPSLIPYVGTA